MTKYKVMWHMTSGYGYNEETIELGSKDYEKAAEVIALRELVSVDEVRVSSLQEVAQ